MTRRNKTYFDVGSRTQRILFIVILFMLTLLAYIGTGFLDVSALAKIWLRNGILIAGFGTLWGVTRYVERKRRRRAAEGARNDLVTALSDIARFPVLREELRQELSTASRLANLSTDNVAALIEGGYMREAEPGLSASNDFLLNLTFAAAGLVLGFWFPCFL